MAAAISKKKAREGRPPAGAWDDADEAKKNNQRRPACDFLSIGSTYGNQLTIDLDRTHTALFCAVVDSGCLCLCVPLDELADDDVTELLPGLIVTSPLVLFDERSDSLSISLICFGGSINPSFCSHTHRGSTVIKTG